MGAAAVGAAAADRPPERRGRRPRTGEHHKIYTVLGTAIDLDRK